MSHRQKYKIWKQFTTPCRFSGAINCCESSAKVQNLKAIHNKSIISPILRHVVSHRQKYKIWKQFTTRKSFSMLIKSLWVIGKSTKSESNSQLRRHVATFPLCCESSAKVQNLKAIHNPWSRALMIFELWVIGKSTKSESNSQLSLFVIYAYVGCESSAKVQNLKAIHNFRQLIFHRYPVVSHRQKYKIWKQFTTIPRGKIKQM